MAFLKTIAIAATFTAGLYLFGSFVAASLDFRDWDVFGRAIIGATWLMAMLGCFAAYTDGRH